jgi:hypothetical protein
MSQRARAAVPRQTARVTAPNYQKSDLDVVILLSQEKSPTSDLTLLGLGAPLEDETSCLGIPFVPELQDVM